MARGTPSGPSKQTTPLSFDPELTWKFTKTMNMHDLARDDDFLSHLFVEKLGVTPLNVHKMDPLRRLPKTDAASVLQIVQRLIRSKSNPTVAIKQSVSDLLSIHPVRYFMKTYEQAQINAFATHASRYLELFLPSGSIEIAQTTRYSKWTGKSELCILATRAMSPGTVITELKGSMADLTDEEDKELARAGYRSENGVRRDFSVIHSKQMKKNHLFLGPARFVNHDCEHNCELFRTGRYITFRVIKPIAVGQEVTAHYGDGYFGRNNRHCLCETCEKSGRGGYAAVPDYSDDSPSSSSGDDSGTETEDDSRGSSRNSRSAKNGKRKGKGKENDQVDGGAGGAGKDVSLDQRSTRRGVYLTLSETDAEDDADGDGDEDASGSKPASGSASASNSDNKVEKASPQPKLEPLDAEAVPAPDESDPTASRSVSVSTILTGLKIASSRASSPVTVTSSPLSSPVRQRRTSHSRSQDVEESISSRRPGRPKKGIHGRHSTSATSSPAPPPVRNTPTMMTRRQKELEEEKEEESRTRRLRSATAANASASATNKTGSNQLGRGRNGMAKSIGLAAAVAVKKKTKKVPCCMTCGNALPPKPPSTTPGEKPAPKGKPREEDCLRCQRHFSIYSAPWPQRISSGLLSRAQSHDPSPSNPLAVLDAKLKAVHESNKAQQEQEQKKKKAEEEREKERKRKEKEKELQKQRNKQKQTTYSSMKRGIGKYMRQQTALSKIHASRQAAAAERVKAANASSKSSSGDTEEKERQPRQPGGRFAKKALTNGRYSRKRTRTYLKQRSIQSQSLKDKSRQDESSESEDDADSSASPNSSKRHRNLRSSGDLPNSKRLKLDSDDRDGEDEEDDDDDEVDDSVMVDDRRDKSFWPALPPLPACGSGFRRSGLLTARPNPAIVSRWRGTPDSEQATPKLVDDNTDNTDDEKSTTPATPDAEERMRVCVADPDITPTTTSSVATDVHAQRSVHEVEERRHSHQHSSFSSDVIEIDDDDVKVVPAVAAPLVVSPAVPRRSSLPVLKGLGFRYKPYSTESPRRTWVATDTSSEDKTNNEAIIVVDCNEETTKKDNTLPRTPNAARLRSSPVRNMIPSPTSAMGAVSITALLSPTRSLKKSSMLGRYAGLVMNDLEPHVTHVYKPLSSFTHLNKTSIDDDADSGEEDTLSGTSDSIHFTLQKSVAFSSTGTSDMSASSTSLSEVLNQEAPLITSRLNDSCLTSEHSTPTRKTRGPSLGHSSALHSCFVAQSTTPVKLVDAGWESSSDTSA